MDGGDPRVKALQKATTRVFDRIAEPPASCFKTIKSKALYLSTMPLKAKHFLQDARNNLMKAYIELI
jgi:hypothetical protein